MFRRRRGRKLFRVLDAKKVTSEKGTTMGGGRRTRLRIRRCFAATIERHNQRNREHNYCTG